jgi:hypothetical protein
MATNLTPYLPERCRPSRPSRPGVSCPAPSVARAQCTLAPRWACSGEPIAPIEPLMKPDKLAPTAIGSPHRPTSHDVPPSHARKKWLVSLTLRERPRHGFAHIPVSSMGHVTRPSMKTTISTSDARVDCSQLRRGAPQRIAPLTRESNGGWAVRPEYSIRGIFPHQAHEPSARGRCRRERTANQ